MTESRTSAALTNSVPNERREQPSPTSLDAAVSVKVIDAFVSPSTPPPGSPCESRSMSLEARVAELESKLATLSKMLRTQQPRGSLSVSAICAFVFLLSFSSVVLMFLLGDSTVLASDSTLNITRVAVRSVGSSTRITPSTASPQTAECTSTTRCARAKNTNTGKPVLGQFVTR